MGQCISIAGSAVRPTSTAKLILADGTLLEFDRAVLAESAVGESDRWFVCDADEMEFDGFVSAVGSHEWLRPGQIYFVLPKSMLRAPLQAEELGALVVKASAALMNSSPRCGKSSVAPLVFEPKADVAVPTAGRRRRMRCCSGKGRKFEPDMCAIPE